MALNTASIRASVSWDYRRTITGFNATKHRDDDSFSLAADVSVMNNALIAQYTLAASGTQTVDLYSLTTVLGEAVTITKLRGLFINVTATVTGGILKIEPGGSNPFAAGLAGTTPSISIPVGTDGAFFAYCRGTNDTVSNTVKNILLTNSGSAQIVVSLFALLGT